MQETLYFGKTYDEVFDDSFKKFTKHIEEDKWRHYNHSLGMWIYNKEQLKHEMKKRRMFPADVCEDLAAEWKKKNPENKMDKLSPKAESIVRYLKSISDKNGNIKLEGKAVEALIEIGAISSSEHMPENFELEGGFKS